MTRYLFEKTKRYILMLGLLCVLFCAVFCGAKNAVEQAEDFSHIEMSSQLPLGAGKTEYIALQSTNTFMSVSEVKDLREVFRKISHDRHQTRNMSTALLSLVLYLFILFSFFLYIPCMSIWREKSRACEELIMYIHDKDGKK